MKKQVSVVILTSRGPRHSYFCRELAKHFQMAGIVVDDRYHMGDRFWTFLKLNGFNPFRMIGSFIQKRKLAVAELRDHQIEAKFFPAQQSPKGAAQQSPEGTEHGSEWPEGVPVRFSPDPNSKENVQWIRSLNPEVIVAFGTRMIQEPVLSAASLGALNLHTGLSPFYRGGQCTFWCVYEGDLEHIGVTIHHLSNRIDGGDIVYTAQPEIEPGDTVRSLECKLIQLGTERMIQAIQELAEGRAPRTGQREKGKLFLSKMFTLEKRLELEEKMRQGWLAKLLEEKTSRQA